MRLRLLHKFVAVIFLVSVLPLALLGWRLITLGQLGVRTAITEYHIATADKVSSEINAYVRGADSAIFSAITALSQMGLDNVLLDTLLKTHKEISEVSLLSKDGKEQLKLISPYHEKVTELKNYSDTPGFKTARKGVRHCSVDEATRFAVLYYHFSKDIVLRAELDLPAFMDSLDLNKVGDNGFSAIVDRSGRPIAWPVELTAEAAAVAAGWEISKSAAGRLSYDARSSTVTASETSVSMAFSDASGNKMLGVYSLNLDLGVAVVVGQPEEEAYKYAGFIKKQAIYAVALFLALAVGAGWFLSRSLTRPITALTRAAERVASGDFSGKAEVSTSDELRDLAETFNTMVTQLKTYSDMQVDRIIREQKNAEAILFSTEDGILMADMDGRVQVANRKARSVLGIAQGAPVEGRPLADLVAAEAIKEPVLDVFGSQKENYFREIELSQAQSTRFFKCFATQITAPEHSKPLGRLIGFYDITLDKELARIKDEFLHSITHDLRNPMGAIKGFVEFMLKEIPGPVNEAQKKMLISIDRASFRLLGMINNILDSAKMEAGKMDISLSPVNLRDVASRVNSLMEPLGQRKRIRFELEGEQQLVIDADAGLLERVFTNLIGNAIKFTPENGAITTGISDDGDHITAWVRDTGDGIPPEYLAKVFEKFEQVKGQKAGGTGLGLTICKFVTSAHLGRIWAESEPGKGAKFLFSIPKNLSKDGEGRVVVKAGGAA